MDELERERKSEEILAYYGGMDNRGEQELIVALLRELQDVYGCITAGVIERAAAVTGVKPSFIRALVRMYPTLKEAAFLHDIVVCMGKACADQGGRDILSFLQKVLKVRRNGISRDGKVRVRTQSCLKPVSYTHLMKSLISCRFSPARRDWMPHWGMADIHWKC